MVRYDTDKNNAGGDYMKKRSISFIIFLCLLFIVSIAGAASDAKVENSPKEVVIVPFINSTEETKDYIAETIQGKYQEQFSNDKYQTVAADKVKAILETNQFDTTNMELPDNELMIKLSQETNADYVIALEVVHFINSRHASFFSTSAKSEVKLRYKVYSKSSNKTTTFQTSGKGNNKVTSIGIPGIGTAMQRGIVQAMDEAFLKIEKL
jgi:hypothetical protein